MISGNLSILYGMKGPNLAMVTACATATHAIGDAGRLIEYGDADVMVAGGAESTVTPTGIAGFGNAKALSTRNDDPTTASRPWTRIATASYSVRAPVWWCWKSMSTRKSVVRAFTASWSALG